MAPAGSPDETKNKSRLSVRLRFVARARELLDSIQFAQHTQLVAEAWTRAYPDFAIPARPAFRDAGESALLPPNLEDHIRKTWLPWENPADDLNSWDTLFALRPQHDWDRLVRAECDRWWPNPDYPNWRTPFNHPAERFVALSILHGPSHANEDDIANETLSVIRLPSDPYDFNKHPTAVIWNTAFRLLSGWVEHHIREGTPPTAAEYAGLIPIIMGHAAHEGARALVVGTAENHLVAPIYSDVRTSDLRRSARSLVDDSNKPLPWPTDDPRDVERRHARTLRDQGLNKKKIAEILDRDPKTVTKLLS